MTEIERLSRRLCALEAGYTDFDELTMGQRTWVDANWRRQVSVVRMVMHSLHRVDDSIFQAVSVDSSREKRRIGSVATRTAWGRVLDQILMEDC